MTLPDDQVIRVSDVLAVGMCGRGLRDWCKTVGVDLNHVLEHGLTVADCRALHDAFADEVIRRMESRNG